MSKLAIEAGVLGAQMHRALKAILREPYGCAFCDSGKLRNPAKGHDEECGFAMAEAIVGSAPYGASMSPSPSDDARAGRDGEGGVGFTPGPWRLVTHHRLGHSGPVPVWYIKASNDVGIAVQPSFSSPIHETANAHLIAAAPELYEALEDCALCLEGTPVGDAARRALAQARGATPPSQQVPTPSSNT